MKIRRSAQERWRRTARRFARRNGFFWIPCVLCGDMLAGQESIGGASVPTVSGDVRQFRAICPKCAAIRLREAEMRLRELGETVEVDEIRGTPRPWVHHSIGAIRDA